MTKELPIADVLTVVTGIQLVKGGDFQAVMDVLFPGIFTIGCAAMQPKAAEEIQRQHPKLREFIRVNSPKEYHSRWLESECDNFVPTCANALRRHADD
jgi:cytochrome b subunit of formate dehydrogenase